jgi:hypothetical protein
MFVKLLTEFTAEDEEDLDGENKQDAFTEAVEYLIEKLSGSENDKSRLLIDPFAQEALYLVAKSIESNTKTRVNINLCDTEVFANLTGDLLLFFYETRVILDLSCQTSDLAEAADTKNKTPEQNAVHVFICCLVITHELINKLGASFAIKYVQTNGLNSHPNFLGDDSLCAQKLILWNEKSPVLLAEYLVENISRLSEFTDEFKYTLWAELKAVDVLIKVTEQYTGSVLLSCCVAIINLMSDTQIGEKEGLKDFARMFCEWLGQFSEAIANETVEREKVLDVEEGLSREMAVLKTDDLQVSLLVILNSLFKLASYGSIQQVRVFNYLGLDRYRENCHKLKMKYFSVFYLV